MALRTRSRLSFTAASGKADDDGLVEPARGDIDLDLAAKSLDSRQCHGV
jgi:hypothetical protein